MRHYPIPITLDPIPFDFESVHRRSRHNAAEGTQMNQFRAARFISFFPDRPSEAFGYSLRILATRPSGSHMMQMMMRALQSLSVALLLALDLLEDSMTTAADPESSSFSDLCDGIILERSAQLDNRGCQDLKWRVDRNSKDVTVGITGTPGATWVGFGISENGGMKFG